MMPLLGAASRRRLRTAVATAFLAGALLVGASACAANPAADAADATAGAGSPGTSSSGSASAAASALSGALTVFAAASLTAPFTSLGEAFEDANPGTHISFSFAGSTDLVTQLIEGAPADVFASADESNMAKATDADLTDGIPIDFATNVLTIAVPPGNPAKITSFADLAAPGVKTVVCAPQVPCGAATVKIEAATGITLAPVSEESSVAGVLSKVSSGEADAGLVYITDVTSAAGSVDSVALPEAAAAVNTYPIVALTDAADSELAAAFVDFVTGPAGRAVLSAAGFGTP